MAEIIATEAQAKSIGNSGASATSNLCVTKVRALALNCGITNSGSYANNLLVRYIDLYCNHSTCNCVGQCSQCSCVGQCSCVNQCNQCSCVGQCSCVDQCNHCNCITKCSCVDYCDQCSCVNQCSCVSLCSPDCCVNMCQCVGECSPDCCVSQCSCVDKSTCCVSQCTCKSSNCVRYEQTGGYCGCDWVCTCYAGCSWAGLDAGLGSAAGCSCHSCSQESSCSDCCLNHYVCTKVSA